MTERVCKACGTVLVNPQGPRKFCSERCRKRQYGGSCVDCGGPTCGSSGRENAPNRCRTCDRVLISERMRAQHKPRNDQMAALYLSGMPLKDIANALGLSKANGANVVTVQLNRLRRYGYDLPHRYRGYDREAAA